MEEIITKSAVGAGGFIATLGLADINRVLSLIVALMTIVYLGISIFKLLRKKDRK